MEDTKEPREPGDETHCGQLEDSFDYFGEMEFFDGSDGVIKDRSTVSAIRKVGWRTLRIGL